LFMAVITAEKSLELTKATVDLAKDTFRVVQGRVEAGKEPPFQASKASAELELTRIEQLDAENALEIAKRKLAAMWGSETPMFSSVAGDINKITPVPSLEILKSKLSQNPSLLRWDDEVEMRKAVLASEKAKLVPDMQGMVGVQNYEEDGSDALKFGVKIFLPLFSRARGGIVAAGSELAKAKEERKAARTALITDLAVSYAGLDTAQSKVLALREKVIPAMEEAFNAAQEGYRQGKFSFMDVLDAQRSLYKTRNAYLMALLDYHAAVADIQKITGTSIGELNKTQRETK
jgi:cobalt-zinc-cadmium efflux system outer membrane protein